MIRAGWIDLNLSAGPASARALEGKTYHYERCNYCKNDQEGRGEPLVCVVQSSGEPSWTYLRLGHRGSCSYCSCYCFGCYHFENMIRYRAQSTRRKSETEFMEHHRVRGCQHTQNEELYLAYFAYSIYLVYLVYLVYIKGRNRYFNESFSHFHHMSLQYPVAAISVISPFCFVPLCFEMREN